MASGAGSLFHDRASRVETRSETGDGKSLYTRVIRRVADQVGASKRSSGVVEQLPCFIVALDEHDPQVAVLTKLAGQLGYVATLVADLASLKLLPAFAEAPRPLVLVPDLGAAGALAEPAIRFAQAEQGHAYLVYVAETIAPDAYKRLLRTQAAEWSHWEGLARELSDAVQHVAGVEPVGRSAKIIAFFPSKGGVGNTTLALETGVHLAALRKRSGGRIAILDLNHQGGTLADALDLEPRFDIAEIAGRPERLDDQLIDIFTSRHSERLDIFASPLRPGHDDTVDPQMIFAALDLMAGRYDVILLDIPCQRLPWIDNLLLGADAVVLSGMTTVPALKQLAAKLAHLDALAIERGKVTVALNQCEVGLFGRLVRRAEIDRALPGRQLAHIRQDVAAVNEALNAGRPLLELLPARGVSKDMRRLAQMIEQALGQPSSVERRGDTARGRKS